MKIRSFAAESVAAALKQVRGELGGSAVVLKTRRITNGAGSEEYEITACLDEPSAGTASRTEPGESANLAGTPCDGHELVQPHLDVIDQLVGTGRLEKRLDAIEDKVQKFLQAQRVIEVGVCPQTETLGRAIGALRAADVPETFVMAFFDELAKQFSTPKITGDLIHKQLTEKIARLTEPEMEFKVGDRLLVMGPAGSGKTSVIGKVAAHLVAEKKLPVKLVTLDGCKVGGIDELESYGDLLGIKVVSPVEALNESNDSARVVLIDTAAWPDDENQTASLSELYRKLNPTCRLMVFSSLMRSSDVDAMVRRTVALEPTHLAFTMTDLTDRWGGVLAATAAGGPRIAMITDSSSGTGSISSPDARVIAGRLLTREVQLG
jgi:flagellar biosynthesis protein FlhF